MSESLYSTSTYPLILSVIALALLFVVFLVMRNAELTQQKPAALQKLVGILILWNLCSLIGMFFFSGEIDVNSTSYVLRQILFGIGAMGWVYIGSASYEIGELILFKKAKTYRTISTLISFFIIIALTVLFIVDPHFFSDYNILGIPLFDSAPIFCTFFAVYLFFLLPTFVGAIYQLIQGSLQETERNLAKTDKYTAATYGFLVVLALVFDFIIPIATNFEGKAESFHFLLWHQFLAVFLVILCHQYFTSASFKNKNALWFLRKIVSKMDDGIIYFNDNGQITYGNQGAAKLLGTASGNLLGKSIRSVFPPNLNFFDEYVYEDIMMDINGEHHSFKIHFFRVRDTLSTTMNVAYFIDQSKTSLLQKDLKALNEQYVEYTHDLVRYQDRLNKEARIKAEKDNVLNTLINALPFRVWYKSELGVYQKQNQKDLNVQGSLEGTNDAPEKITSYEKNARERGEAGVYTSFVDKNGNEISQDDANKLTKEGAYVQTFDNMYIPILQGKAPFKTLCIKVDLTEQRRLERERNMLREQKFIHSRLEELGTMCGAFAHDYNNILGSQIGFCQLAQEMLPPDHKASLFISEALKAAQRGKASLEELLNTIRGNTRSATAAIMIPPYMIIEDVVKKLNLTLPPNISINSEDLDKNVKIRGVVASLDRIISNMANNALFAMKESGGSLTFQLHSVALDTQLVTPFAPPIPAGSYAKIVISDTGTGMDSGTLERIFAPFFTTKAPGEGLGLGLSSALRLLKEGHAYFTVQTTLGKGTTFNLYWPLETESKEK